MLRRGGKYHQFYYHIIESEVYCMAEIKKGGEQFSSRWGLLCTILGMAVKIRKIILRDFPAA